MANPIKDIAGMVGAKIQNASVNHQLALRLVDKIGPRNVIGDENGQIYYSRLRKMIDANKQEDAAYYADQQRAKVNQESWADKTQKRYSRTVK